MADKKEPVLECPTCYSTNFNLSRQRPEDRMQRLMLRYPVRCRKCNARIYADRAYAKYLREQGKVSPMEGKPVQNA